MSAAGCLLAERAQLLPSAVAAGEEGGRLPCGLILINLASHGEEGWGLGLGLLQHGGGARPGEGNSRKKKGKTVGSVQSRGRRWEREEEVGLSGSAPGGGRCLPRSLLTPRSAAGSSSVCAEDPRAALSLPSTQRVGSSLLASRGSQRSTATRCFGSRLQVLRRCG